MPTQIVVPDVSSIATRKRSTKKSAEADEPKLGFLGFILNEEEFGIDLKLVKQIVKPPPLTWVPKVSPHILGIISIRGSVVTLIDTRLLMGLPATDWPKTGRVLLVDLNDERVGLLVDAVTQVRRVSLNDFEVSPNLQDSAKAEKVVGIIRPEPEIQITVLDLTAILAEVTR